MSRTTTMTVRLGGALSDFVSANVGDDGSHQAHVTGRTRHADIGLGQIGVEVQVQARWPLLNAAQHEMLYGVIANGTQIDGMLDRALHSAHFEGFQEAQNLDVLALARLTHSGFEQSVQGGEDIW